MEDGAENTWGIEHVQMATATIIPVDFLLYNKLQHHGTGFCPR